MWSWDNNIKNISTQAQSFSASVQTKLFHILWVIQIFICRYLLNHCVANLKKKTHGICGCVMTLCGSVSAWSYYCTSGISTRERVERAEAACTVQKNEQMCHKKRFVFLLKDITKLTQLTYSSFVCAIDYCCFQLLHCSFNTTNTTQYS